LLCTSPQQHFPLSRRVPQPTRPKMSSSDTEKKSLEHIEERELEGGKPVRHGANGQMDEGAKVLDEAGGTVEYSAEDSKRVLRKIDLWVCVPMCIVYCVQQMDKSSVSYAAVFGLQADTGLHGTQYSWLTSVVYIAQLCFQPLSSYALIVFPVKYWVMFNYISWSIVTIATAAAHNFTGLIISRLLLGIFEATILPSFVLITQMWWTRREQSYRTIAYQIANSMAGEHLGFSLSQFTDTSALSAFINILAIFGENTFIFALAASVSYFHRPLDVVRYWARHLWYQTVPRHFVRSPFLAKRLPFDLHWMICVASSSVAFRWPLYQWSGGSFRTAPQRPSS